MIGIKPFLRIVSLLVVAVAAGQLVETLRAQNASPASDTLAEPKASGVGALVGITPVSADTGPTVTDACATTLQLAASAGAMIDLMLSAPCSRGERVVLRHADLAFTAVIGPDGQLRLQVPALQAQALVAAYLDDAQLALGQVSVPDLASVTRFAVQLPPSAQFDLRAVTEDRIYVRANGGAAAEAGARVIGLGAAQAPDPILAQIYTHPGPDLTTAELTVELRITDKTCGRTLPVETWLSRGGEVQRSSLGVAVPLCGTAGDILLLKNLVPAPTLSTSD